MTAPLAVLSSHLESLLVAKNHRGMAFLRDALPSGSYLRAATLLNNAEGNVFIITGFPIADTFETDGPPGALVIYDHLEALGATPWIVADSDLAEALAGRARALTVPEASHASQLIERLSPALIVTIERPGEAADGRFYNIRGIDISGRCHSVAPLLAAADCPIIAIGDGGNEVGMGKALTATEALPITPSVVTCDELLVADVSNWGAYGLVLLSAYALDPKNLPNINPAALLSFVVSLGAVDGVTGRCETTEDGLSPEKTSALLEKLTALFNSDVHV